MADARRRDPRIHGDGTGSGVGAGSGSGEAVDTGVTTARSRSRALGTGGTAAAPSEQIDLARDARTGRSRLTRDRVLAIVLELLETGGEAAVRIDEVHARAGVSIGSIYHHFGDRDGLIVAAQLRRFARFAQSEIAALSEIVQRSANLEQFRRAIRQLTLTSRSTVREAERWGRIGVLGSSIGRVELQSEIRTIQTRLTDEFQSHVAQGQARGFFRDDLDARAIAVFVEAYTLGFALNDLDERGVDEKDWERVVWSVLDGLLVDPDAAPRA
jgi:AcrR family transcriptional regulator